MNFLNRIIKNTFTDSSDVQSDSSKSSLYNQEPIKKNLFENIQFIRDELGNSSDLVIREFQLGVEQSIPAAIFFTDGLTDIKSVQKFILSSTMLELPNTINLDKWIAEHKNAFELLKEHSLSVGEIQEINEFSSLFTSLLSGETILLLDGYAQALTLGMSDWRERGVTESTTETVIRGPKEGFTENLRSNTALIRRKIKDPHLWLETKSIGRMTKTDVSIMYIQGIVSDEIVKEVRSRLDRIDIDGILESGYIEELIEDETYTPFPTIYNTERPDVIAADLLEGKVAILVDGTPVVLTVPSTFISFVQAAEDYYQRADVSTFIRLLRFLSIFISLLGPSLYIATTTFHQEMLPTQLLISLAAQREGVPFPAFIEALMMEVSFEILREASLRMPKTISQSISIVGTLVIGTAAVEAGIISAAMVIVVAITAVSSFVLPSYNMTQSIRVLRFPMMALGASFGLFGIIIGGIVIVLHLCSLRSFGVPYMAPFAPFNMEDMKDTLFRMPRWAMFTRPRLYNNNNRIRTQSTPPDKPRENTGG